MNLEFLIKKFQENFEKEAVIWKGEAFNYRWLFNRYNFWVNKIKENNVNENTVTIIEGDFSPNAICLFLALVSIDSIIVPLTKSVSAKKEKFIQIAKAENIICLDEKDEVAFTKLECKEKSKYYELLSKRKHPGLVLFSSGSTGESKAAVHDLKYILEKFLVPKRTLRTIAFLLYDHIGGVNTMFYTLANAGCMITVQDRSADSVLESIQKYKAELLPTSPTFINLILISEAYKRYNLESLKTVTYGTEMMPQSTLKKFHSLFPNIKLQQTYGLSEVGILRSKSKSSDSLWVKVGGEGYETRIENGLLEIKSNSAMLGYLNAPSPFTEDGWFKTGDAVEVDGEYFKFKGRKSELINVGGEKVYPQEVENVILELNDILDVTVFGAKNPITGNIVCAKIKLKPGQDEKQIKMKIKSHCRKLLEAYKIPVKIVFNDSNQHTERFKKNRS